MAKISFYIYRNQALIYLQN